MTELHLKDTIGPGWSYANGITIEGLTDLKDAAPEKNAAIILDFANLGSIRIFDRGQALWKRPQARLISGGRHLEIQRIMRSLEVVLLSPPIKGFLQMSRIAPLMSANELVVKSPVEPFVLSHGLGMIRSAVSDLDAETNQPDAESRKREPLMATPGAAVVHQHGIRKIIWERCIDRLRMGEHETYSWELKRDLEDFRARIGPCISKVNRAVNKAFGKNRLAVSHRVATGGSYGVNVPNFAMTE
jgi:hypothetical protein